MAHCEPPAVQAQPALNGSAKIGIYDHAMPVPAIFQVRSLETDELFDVDTCNAHTLEERASNDPARASAMLDDNEDDVEYAGMKCARTAARPRARVGTGLSNTLRGAAHPPDGIARLATNVACAGSCTLAFRLAPSTARPARRLREFRYLLEGAGSAFGSRARRPGERGNFLEPDWNLFSGPARGRV
jgi:hypothetical protein